MNPEFLLISLASDTLYDDANLGFSLLGIDFLENSSRSVGIVDEGISLGTVHELEMLRPRSLEQ